jgi:MFS family permease
MTSDKDKINRSLKFSLLDGIFASGMVGFTQDYFTPFILLLGATTRHVGMLSAFPNLVSSLIQLKSPDLTVRLKSRKMIINFFVFLQAIMLLPMVFIALKRGTHPFVFIILAVLFTSCGALVMPAWSSLMSDLVDKTKRGEYFGWRNKIFGLIVVGTSLLAGLILQLVKKWDIFYGFVLIFLFAFVCRIISWNFLRQMHEPEIAHSKEYSFTFFQFIRRFRESNFVRFALFISLMNFSVNLAAPFFAVLMLRDLHFSYLLYTIISITATLTVYCLMQRWGKFADKFGNLRILRITSPLIGIIPFLWVINRNPLFLLFVQALSGFAWAGFNLCSSNFIYDCVTPEKRTRCISYFNLFNGLGLCLGALIGGYLAPRLPELFSFKILSLFVISGCMRLLVSLFIPRSLKEVKQVDGINNSELLAGVIGLKRWPESV